MLCTSHSQSQLYAVSALGQLDEQIRENRYSDIAQTLAVRNLGFTCHVKIELSVPQAVKQITASFKQYASLHRMTQITRRVQEIQNELRAKIDSDWDKL